MTSQRNPFGTIGAVVVSVAVMLAGLALGAGPASAAQKITPNSFGIHAFTTDPQVPTGTIRMNCWPSWRQIEPTRGNRHWAIMDATLRRVESWGVRDVLFVFCGTPAWAAGSVKDPSKELPGPTFGPKSTAAPKNMADWRSFVTAFVRRYAGRIDSYQAWNEMTSPQFYQGTPRQMAIMTGILNDVVAAHDPSALVVSASVQTHVLSWYRTTARKYLKALKARGWPVDAAAGHFYPLAKGGPNERRKQVAMFTKDLKKYKAPRRVQKWDTEANFWTSVPGNPRAGRVKGKKAAAFVARNYLDSWDLGLRRSYWYMWSDKYEVFPGVQLRAGDPGTRAYRTLGSWTTGAKFKRCTGGKLVKCGFTRAGKKFTVAFTTKGKATYRFKGKKPVCPVTGAKCKKQKKKTTVRTLPVRIG